MSPEIYLHEHHDFFDLIRVVAGERRIDPIWLRRIIGLCTLFMGSKKPDTIFSLKEEPLFPRGSS